MALRIRNGRGTTEKRRNQKNVSFCLGMTQWFRLLSKVQHIDGHTNLNIRKLQTFHIHNQTGMA